MVDTLTLVHFLLLGFAVVASFRFPLIAPSMVLTSIGLAHYIGLIDLIGIITLVVFYSLAWYLPKTETLNVWLRRAVHGCFILMCIGLAAHVFPGFNKYVVFQNLQKSDLSIPYSLILSIDKVHIFFAVLMAVRTFHTSYVINNRVAQYLILTVILLGLLQYASIPIGLMKFDFGLPQWTPIWAFSNLLFTSAAEEAFFRHYLQRRLHKRMPPALTIIIVGVLFGLAHFAGGPIFMILAALAGIGYGTIYYLTGGKLLAAILIHFGFNLTHLILFSYPLPL